MSKEYLTHKQACEAMEAGAFIREADNGCLYWSEILHTPYGADRYIFYLDENDIAQTTSFDPTWDDEVFSIDMNSTDWELHPDDKAKINKRLEETLAELMVS